MPSDRKTEPPTPRRLRRARREGDHPLSRALVAAGALGLALLAAPLALRSLERATLAALAGALRSGPVPAPSEIASRVALGAGPLLAAAALGALAIGLVQTGGTLSFGPLRWDARRINPFGGRSPRAALTPVIAAASALGVLLAAALIASRMGAALADGVGDARGSLTLATRACERLGWSALGITLLGGAADALYQRIAWLRRHRMTPEEVRRELRENEGDPELRRARQKVQRELLGGGAPAELARASLLVVGAPPLAIALAYAAERDRAPRVVARGAGARALSLEALAASYGVPVERDAELARALGRLPLDHEVPSALFAEVARAMQRAGIVR